MSGASQLTASEEYIGRSGTGTFSQTSGTNTVTGSLTLGDSSGATGTYDLSGNGNLSASGYVYVGNSGTGVFTQSGGTNTISSSNSLMVGVSSGSNGTYILSGSGQLSAGSEYIGNSGTGTFTQTGGMNTIANALYLGKNTGSSGTYNLIGSLQLSAASEYIGNSGTGTFTQTGGSNTVIYVKIGANGTYTLKDGTLNINGGFENQGVFDLSNNSATINAVSAIIDSSGSFFANAGNASINLDSNSLFIVPTGVDPTLYFKNYINNGMLHQAGSTLDILSTNTIYGVGSFNDHVNCWGLLSATPGYSINLNAGLNISDAGSVALGSGTLYVNDSISGISGGSLSASYQYVGSSGTGSFTQSGGNISISYFSYVGYSTVGTFNQTGGTNSISYTFFLGYNSGSSGTYNLSGGKNSAGGTLSRL